MNLTTKQLDLFRRNNATIVVLATADVSSRPRGIFVEVNQVDGDKIIITDNQMVKTKNNLLENKNVFLLAFEDDYSYGLKISGVAEYITDGEYFESIKNLETNKNFVPKGAVVVNVREIAEF